MDAFDSADGRIEYGVPTWLRSSKGREGEGEGGVFCHTSTYARKVGVVFRDRCVAVARKGAGKGVRAYSTWVVNRGCARGWVYELLVPI